MDFFRRMKAKRKSWSHSFNENDLKKSKPKDSKKKQKQINDITYVESTDEGLSFTTNNVDDPPAGIHYQSAQQLNHHSTEDKIHAAKSLEDFTGSTQSLPNHQKSTSKGLKFKSWNSKKKRAAPQPPEVSGSSLPNSPRKMNGSYVSYDQDYDSENMIIHGVFDSPPPQNLSSQSGSNTNFRWETNIVNDNTGASKGIPNFQNINDSSLKIEEDLQNIDDSSLKIEDVQKCQEIPAKTNITNNNDDYYGSNVLNDELDSRPIDLEGTTEKIEATNIDDIILQDDFNGGEAESKVVDSRAEFEEVLNCIDKVLENESIISEGTSDTYENIPKLRLGSLVSNTGSEEIPDDDLKETKFVMPNEISMISPMESEIKSNLRISNEEYHYVDFDGEILSGGGEALAAISHQDSDTFYMDNSGDNSTCMEDSQVLEWDAHDVNLWCKRQNLQILKDLFEGSNIDGPCLLQINDDDLVNLGVTEDSLRQKILRCVERLKVAADVGVVEGGEEAIASGTRSMLEMNTSAEIDLEIEKIWNKIESPYDAITGEQKSSPRYDTTTVNSLTADLDNLDGNIVKVTETITDMKMSLQRSSSVNNLLSDSRNVDYAELEYKLANAESLLLSLQQQKATIMADMKRSQLRNVPERRRMEAIGHSNLYGFVKIESKEAVAVEVSIQAKDHHGFLVTEDNNGGVQVTCAEDGIPLIKGDRIVEVNGHGIPAMNVTEFNELLSQLDPPLRLVVLRNLPQSQKTSSEQEEQLQTLTQDLSIIMNDLTSALNENKELEGDNERYAKIITKLEEQKDHLHTELDSTKEQLSGSDKKWRQLYNLLEKLKVEDVDYDALLGTKLDWNKDKKTAAVKAFEKERREYLQQISESNAVSRDVDVPYELLNDDIPIWESLRNSSKEEILQALKDHVIEHHRQKVFLNRLMGVVIKRCPNILASVLDDISFNDVKSKPQHMV
ncbi:uncharacterized protein LOC141898444 [Tubulanus polymorphus]|uniref:uncharacterized protein LOC141898444 n=1 Tax=Tubulanus polymorphus TaxID=672921 RepID=UPI003DA22DF0